MKHLISLMLAVLILVNLGNAQIVQSELKTQALFTSINMSEQVSQNPWNIQLRTVIKKPGSFGNIEALKRRNLEERKNEAPTLVVANKTLGAQPSVGKSFKGNDLKSFTPSDNTIAISNDGKIVSLVNQNFEVYDTNGNQLLTQAGWNNFLGDDSVALIRGKFDPRVLYDPYHDRFVLCILHAPADTTFTSIILAFSQSNDPTQGWNIYNVPGNPLQNGGWTDYPSIGMTEYELFINANLFQGAPNYGYLGTYIQQIDLDSAYAGGMLQYRTWSGFDPNKFITINPAPDGLMQQTGQRNMHFVMLNPGEDTLVYHFEITDTMNAPGVSISRDSARIPYYSVCPIEYIKDPNSSTIDSIQTGSAWIHNAYTMNNIIHFTFAANAAGRCGVHYGQYDLGTTTAKYTVYKEDKTSLAFPAIAPLGYDSVDKNTAMIFVRADTNTLPEIGLITIDDSMNWSNPVLIKQGDTIVNILGAGGERWGDYSGIARKYNATTPEVWIFGCYAANTPPRLNSWGNWIAQVRTNDYPLEVNNELKQDSEIKLYPNPTRNTFALSFELDKKSDVKIALFDINGRKVKTLFNGDLPPSHNEFAFDRNALPNGQYFIIIDVNGQRSAKKLVIVE